jgi:hypothetical protein
MFASRALSDESSSAKAGMPSVEPHQNLTKTIIPVMLPLTKGFVNGFEVFYFSTEASDKELASHLTNFTGSSFLCTIFEEHARLNHSQNSMYSITALKELGLQASGQT